MSKTKLVLRPEDVTVVAARELHAPVETPQRVAKEIGEPLNFRVPAPFNRRFRVYAATNGLKLQDVLMQAFEALEREGK